MPPAVSADPRLEAWIAALRSVLIGADAAITLDCIEQPSDAIGALDATALADTGAAAGWCIPDVAPGVALRVLLHDSQRRGDAVAVLQAAILAVELRRRHEGRPATAYSQSVYAEVRKRVHAIRNSLNSLVMNAAVLSYEQRAAGNPFAARIDSDARECSQALTRLVGSLEPGAAPNEPMP